MIFHCFKLTRRKTSWLFCYTGSQKFKYTYMSHIHVTLVFLGSGPKYESSCSGWHCMFRGYRVLTWSLTQISLASVLRVTNLGTRLGFPDTYDCIFTIVVTRMGDARYTKSILKCFVVSIYYVKFIRGIQIIVGDVTRLLAIHFRVVIKSRGPGIFPCY